jgi:uridine phosphorylase
LYHYSTIFTRETLSHRTKRETSSRLSTRCWRATGGRHARRSDRSGCRKFIACGGAGVLDGDIADGHIIVPTTAIRDEGTSYHYLPPCREVGANKEAVAAIEKVLQAHRCEYILSKTWTTDAIYRETAAKVLHRKAEGCTTVEMEAAAFFAVAQFRSVQFGQLLYGGDDVSRSEWDSRHWDSHTSVRKKLFLAGSLRFQPNSGG